MRWPLAASGIERIAGPFLGPSPPPSHIDHEIRASKKPVKAPSCCLPLACSVVRFLSNPQNANLSLSHGYRSYSLAVSYASPVPPRNHAGDLEIDMLSSLPDLYVTSVAEGLAFQAASQAGIEHLSTHHGTLLRGTIAVITAENVEAAYAAIDEAGLLEKTLG